MSSTNQNHQPLLSTVELSKSFKEGKMVVDILKEISFNIYPQSMTAIIGSSGSGKSTLLHLLGGLDKPTSGEVIFKSQSINQLSESKKAILRNKEMGFIYQFHHLLPDFTALENIAMPLLISGIKIHQAKEKAYHMLEAINLAHRSHHKPAELSGGERQRVAIGRALINDPSLVLADEPTGNLDQETAEIIFNLLIMLNKQFGTAFLVVTHDLTLAKKMEQQFMMTNGKLISVNQ